MIHYYSRPGGVTSVDGDYVPDGGVEITEAAYNAALAVLDADRLARQADAGLAECLIRKAVYDDLTASVHTSDWDAATIEYLSGYSPGDC